MMQDSDESTKGSDQFSAFALINCSFDCALDKTIRDGHRNDILRKIINHLVSPSTSLGDEPINVPSSLVRNDRTIDKQALDQAILKEEIRRARADPIYYGVSDRQRLSHQGKLLEEFVTFLLTEKFRPDFTHDEDERKEVELLKGFQTQLKQTKEKGWKDPADFMLHRRFVPLTKTFGAGLAAYREILKTEGRHKEMQESEFCRNIQYVYSHSKKEEGADWEEELAWRELSESTVWFSKLLFVPEDQSSDQSTGENKSENEVTATGSE